MEEKDTIRKDGRKEDSREQEKEKEDLDSEAKEKAEEYTTSIYGGVKEEEMIGTDGQDGMTVR